MTDEIRAQIQAHTAGAIIRHSSPFDFLQSYQNPHTLDSDFLQKWIIPFYMNCRNSHMYETVAIQLKTLKPQLNDEIILQCLGDFNWRTRLMGAYFAALDNRARFIELIGTHLLKSEVCFAGKVYAKVLAYFNTPECVAYLNLYAEYYLCRPDLYFDQFQVLEAICYLDGINQTHNWENLQPLIEKFGWADFKPDPKIVEKYITALKNI